MDPNNQHYEYQTNILSLLSWLYILLTLAGLLYITYKINT